MGPGSPAASASPAQHRAVAEAEDAGSDSSKLGHARPRKTSALSTANGEPQDGGGQGAGAFTGSQAQQLRGKASSSSSRSGVGHQWDASPDVPLAAGAPASCAASASSATQLFSCTTGEAGTSKPGNSCTTGRTADAALVGSLKAGKGRHQQTRVQEARRAWWDTSSSSGNASDVEDAAGAQTAMGALGLPPSSPLATGAPAASATSAAPAKVHKAPAASHLYWQTSSSSSSECSSGSSSSSNSSGGPSDCADEGASSSASLAIGVPETSAAAVAAAAAACGAPSSTEVEQATSDPSSRGKSRSSSTFPGSAMAATGLAAAAATLKETGCRAGAEQRRARHGNNISGRAGPVHSRNRGASMAWKVKGASQAAAADKSQGSQHLLQHSGASSSSRGSSKGTDGGAWPALLMVPGAPVTAATTPPPVPPATAVMAAPAAAMAAAPPIPPATAAAAAATAAMAPATAATPAAVVAAACNRSYSEVVCQGSSRQGPAAASTSAGSAGAQGLVDIFQVAPVATTRYLLALDTNVLVQEAGRKALEQWVKAAIRSAARQGISVVQLLVAQVRSHYIISICLCPGWVGAGPSILDPRPKSFQYSVTKDFRGSFFHSCPQAKVLRGSKFGFLRWWVGAKAVSEKLNQKFLRTDFTLITDCLRANVAQNLTEYGTS